MLQVMNKGKKISNEMSLRSARMLVPKFSYEENGNWYIHWPKDQYQVVSASTEEELVVRLAHWLQELGRVGNEVEHVDPNIEQGKLDL